MTLPTSLDYPILAIGDLHGQRDELVRLVNRLERFPEWDACALVFLGDFVDRGEDVPGTIDLVLDLLSRGPSGSAILGNHDLALVRTARLDDGPASKPREGGLHEPELGSLRQYSGRQELRLGLRLDPRASID